MNTTKWKKGEREHISYARNKFGIRCRHCSAIFSYNSRHIKYYVGWSYLCKDCKTLVIEYGTRVRNLKSMKGDISGNTKNN